MSTNNRDNARKRLMDAIITYGTMDTIAQLRDVDKLGAFVDAFESAAVDAYRASLAGPQSPDLAEAEKWLRGEVNTPGLKGSAHPCDVIAAELDRLRAYAREKCDETNRQQVEAQKWCNEADRVERERDDLARRLLAAELRAGQLERDGQRLATPPAAPATPPDAGAVPAEASKIPNEMWARVWNLHDQLGVIGKREGGKVFMGAPDRWFEHAHWRCPNDHVSERYLKSEAVGASLCLECYAPVCLTFPEDKDGPLPAPASPSAPAPCGTCGGKGRILDHEKPHWSRCKACGGSGKLPDCAEPEERLVESATVMLNTVDIVTCDEEEHHLWCRNDVHARIIAARLLLPLTRSEREQLTKAKE